MQPPHIPVMLNEVLEALDLAPNKHVLDCTFGAGGYTKAILDKQCFVTSIDCDPNVEIYAQNLKQNFKNHFRFMQENFANFHDLANTMYDGIVLDLGVSSMQLDNGDRGFSFMHEGPLDMRMGQTGQTAAEFIAGVDEEDLANIIYRYGDEQKSRTIASAIIAERKIAPIVTTRRLAQIVRSAVGHRGSKIDNATKTFLAIRIYINQELAQLEQFLENVKKILKPSGRLVVVSFHSLEDTIVKNFFKQNSAAKIARSKYAKPIDSTDDGWLEILTKKPLSCSYEETRINPRARSAKLRAAARRTDAK